MKSQARGRSQKTEVHTFPMSYVVGTDVPEPARDQRIWRYVKLSWFMYLLTEKKLYFSRLWELEDSWEGRVSYAQVNDLCADMDDTQHREFLPTLLQLYTNFAAGCAISCWHASDTESVAMWQLYATGTDGIAISTTVEKLESSLAFDGVRDMNFHIGNVQYIDHEANVLTERPPERITALQSLFQKSREYSHEREVRFVLILPQGKSSLQNSVIPLGNLNFIDEIIVSPTFPSWALPSIQSILSTVGVTAPIKTSMLTGRLRP
jgi:hypothetical protein